VGKRFTLCDLRLVPFVRKSLEFKVGESGQVLTMSARVLKRFEKYQQWEDGSAEAGGQLFARLSSTDVVIEEATGPRASDLRTRTLYVPDRAAEQAEIDSWHTRRLHYVGDWHTHPELHPEPSGSDRESIRESFIRSKHSLRGFLMVIVGTAEFPNGLYVSLNDSENELVLVPRAHGSHREKGLAKSGRAV
jgi:integrative and conjugative element protein (TIGR02256 family)